MFDCTFYSISLHSESDEDETKQLVDDIELQIVPIIPKTRPKLEDDSPVSPK